MVRSAPIAWLTRRLLAAAMVLLASSPHIASAAESLAELSEERPVPCCPMEEPETPDPSPGDDCSRTCRSCHCCLPVVLFDGALPGVGPSPTVSRVELAPVSLGADLPAHTRTLFRPPAT